jgi:hypothetical protein
LTVRDMLDIGQSEVFASSILTGQLLLVYSLKAGRFCYSKGRRAGKRELALRGSELLVDEEGRWKL